MSPTIDQPNLVTLVDGDLPEIYVETPVATITLNSGPKKFFIHTGLLLTYSGYFRGCLQHKFSEGETLAINIEGESQEAFSHVASWLYDDELDEIYKDGGSITSPVIRVYKLADRLIMPLLKNDLLDSLRQRLQAQHVYPRTKNIIEMYNVGLLESKLGMFLVEKFAWELKRHPEYWSIFTLDEDTKKRYWKYHELNNIPEIAEAIAKCLERHKGKEWSDPVMLKGCVYHEHEEGEVCRNQIENVQPKEEQQKSNKRPRLEVANDSNAIQSNATRV